MLLIKPYTYSHFKYLWTECSSSLNNDENNLLVLHHLSNKWNIEHTIWTKDDKLDQLFLEFVNFAF